MRTIKDQLAAEFGCIVIEAMDNRGYAFDIAVPTANLKLAELEENLAEMRNDLVYLERHFETLVGAGERVEDVENWGIFYDGKLFHDGYYSHGEAHLAAWALADEMGQHSDEYARLANERLSVECVARFRRSQWLSKLSKQMRMHMVQIDQTDKLIEAVKAA